MDVLDISDMLEKLILATIVRYSTRLDEEDKMASHRTLNRARERIEIAFRDIINENNELRNQLNKTEVK